MLLEKQMMIAIYHRYRKNAGQFAHVQENFQENHDRNLVNSFEKE